MGIFSKIKGSLLAVKEKVFVKFRKIDANQISCLEENLIQSDFGVEMTQELLARIERERPKDINSYIKNYLLDELKKGESDLLNREMKVKPYVILVIGVNGNGKTTTIAKLANYYARKGLKVRVAAGDTFRAAAVEQLSSWAEKCGCGITIGTATADPASVAYTAYHEAKEDDVLIIDTAGRLHTRDDLMNELLKIKKVLKKQNAEAPHETVLVLDGITGQNAFSQIEKFSKIIGIDSTIMTKLDSTSKGGAIVGIIKKYHLPISAICFGEDIDDISAFSAKQYIDSVFE